jgi:hypothetical protein
LQQPEYNAGTTETLLRGAQDNDEWGKIA